MPGIQGKKKIYLPINRFLWFYNFWCPWKGNWMQVNQLEFEKKMNDLCNAGFILVFLYFYPQSFCQDFQFFWRVDQNVACSRVPLQRNCSCQAANKSWNLINYLLLSLAQYILLKKSKIALRSWCGTLLHFMGSQPI